MSSAMDRAKNQKWFYEFELPDGTRTESYLPPAARGVHVTRERALRTHLSALDDSYSTAIDVACHEGFFSLVLAEHFKSVTGFDRNSGTLDKARQISALVGASNIRFEDSTLELWREEDAADFVLCFGLLYHVENPIQVLRKLAAITNRTLCIETQVLPYDMVGKIEDGSYLWQRDLHGMFGLCVDYSDKPEGGLTDLALVPSRQALEFLLVKFGFSAVTFYTAASDDYEQFTRNQRVIVFAEKSISRP